MRMKFVPVMATQLHFTNIMHGDEKAGKYEETKHQLVETARKNSGAIAIGLGITALLIAVAGVCCCKYKKTCCFKSEDGVAEGGAKETYRKEIKKSHKKHAKESLVPDFNVEA